VSQVLHILRKDLRRLRWLLIMWMAILAARVILAVIGSATAGVTFPAAFALREVDVVLPLLHTVMLALLVARLIHEEPLVGWNAFWLTRPYSTRALVTAKLLFLVVVMVLLPLAADLSTMAVFKAGARAQLTAAPTFGSTHVTWALGLAVVAVLTPSLATFVLTIVGGVVAIAVTLLLLIAVSLVFGLAQTTAYDGPLVANPTPGIVSMIVFIATALGVIAYQYRHRRWLVAATLGAVGLVASMIVPGVWPGPLEQPQQPAPGPWTRSLAATSVRIDPRLALDIAQNPFETAPTPKRRVHAFVELLGMPADAAVQGVRVSGTLRLEDGTTLRSSQMESFSREYGTTVGIVPTITETPAHAALGDIEILNERESRQEYWPALLSLTQEEHARHKGQTGRFDGTLRFHVYRTVVGAALPLREGATKDDGLTRIEVVRAQPIDGGYRLVVRHWQALPFMESGRSHNFQFVLRNRRLRNAVELGEELSWSGSFAGTSRGGMILSAALPGWSFGSSAESGFDVHTQALQFPWRMQGGAVGLARLDRGWFDDAELVVLDTVYGGPVTRSVTIADFRIPEE